MTQSLTLPCVRMYGRVSWTLETSNSHSPGVPRLASCCPFGASRTTAFQGLSDLELANIVSFLGDGSVDSLASTSRWAMACPELAPRTRVLARRDGSIAALRRLLSVRGGGSCKEVVVKNTPAMEALLVVLREGHGIHLTSLVVDGDKETRTRVGAAQLSNVLWLLPHLRRLHLLATFDGEGRWTVVWWLLGSGACPRLEELAVKSTVGWPVDVHPEVIVFLTALRERTALGIAPLRTLCLQGQPFYVLSYIERPNLRLPEQVELSLTLTEPQMADLATCFRRSAGGRWLRSLTVESHFTERPDGSAMVTALVESGLAQGLRELGLVRMRLNAQAFNALGASLSSSCGEAQLEKLDMTETIPTNQEAVASYTEFVAAALFSCPSLKQLVLGHDHLWHLREELVDLPPPTFSPLTLLKTSSSLVVQRIAQASPGQLASLQHLEIGPGMPPFGLQPEHGVMTSLARALPAMTNLRDLKLYTYYQSDDEGDMRLLADALTAGCARELRSLHLRWSATDYATVLRALANGSCPKLRELRLEGAPGELGVLSVEGQWALGGLLKGEPGRSASLTVLEVEEAFVLTDLGLQCLSLALSEPTGACLESLTLSCQPALLPGPQRLHMVDNLIAALEQPRTGSRLAKLQLDVFNPPSCDERLSAEDLEPLKAHLQDALTAGSWPCMPVKEGPVILLDNKESWRIILLDNKESWRISGRLQPQADQLTMRVSLSGSERIRAALCLLLPAMWMARAYCRRWTGFT